ncbi:MAG TPA: HD domain-containing phosphohydrolase, partial [Geobacteraceae bacterium]|nr:HD domain-containing phosphohydrolase [Geobacteraceae bacterium]
MIPEQATHLNTFIRQMTTAVSTSQLYSLDHEQVQRLCVAAAENLSLATGDEPGISLLLIDDELVAWDRPLETSMYINRFCQALKTRGIGHLRLQKKVTPEELRQMIPLLSRAPLPDEEIRSTENIRFGRVEVKELSDQSEETEDELEFQKIRSLADVSLEELSTFMEIYEEARSNKKLNIKGISEIVGCFINAFKQVADPILALAPLRALDEYTFTHSTNVCVLNLAQAMSLGIDGPLLQDIGVAAMLHDIGKLYVPEEILTKPGKLDDHEWEMIKMHPLRGAERLLDTPGVPRLAVVTAYEHHMKYNLSGYPPVQEGWQQNLCSQMTTVSDFFDALRTKRSYREAMEFDTVSSMMFDISGRDIHPILTRNFLQIIARLS